MVEKSVELATAQCPPLPRKARQRGGAAGGGVRKRFRVESLELSCT